MDDVRAKAEADLAKVSEKVRRLTADLDAARSEQSNLTAFLAVLDRYSATASAGVERRRSVERAARPTSHNVGSGGKSLRLVGAAIEEIRSAGRPLSISELVERLGARGLEIGGARPAPNLAGYLSRSPLIRFEHGKGWMEDRSLEDVAAAPPKEDGAAA